MEIREEIKKESITLHVEGRIDTNTSVDMQKKLLSTFQKCAYVELDMAEVDYISSAGLRVMLIGEKTAQAKAGRMTVCALQPQVKRVFEMSGFDKILHFA